MSTETRVRKFTRYGAISAALLLAAGSATLLGIPARADSLTAGSCDNAPKTGAEYLSDLCNWRTLEATTENAGQQRQTPPRQGQGPQPVW